MTPDSDVDDLIEQFVAITERIAHEGGPTFNVERLFEVPGHRIAPRRWRVALDCAVELLNELREDEPDAARASRLTDTVWSVLSGVELSDALETLRDIQVGRGRRAQGRELSKHRKPDPDKLERDEHWRKRSEELLAEGERSERARARRIRTEERDAGHHFSEGHVRDVLRRRARQRR